MNIDDRIGEVDAWTLPITDADPITLKGRYLGMSSSRARRHTHSEDLPKGERCSACRWTEFRLFREEEDAQTPYLIHYTGASVVPGETPRQRFEEMLGAYELIEVLTTRRPGRPPFLSIPAGRVLTQAIAFDGDLRRAWDNRLVV